VLALRGRLGVGGAVRSGVRDGPDDREGAHRLTDRLQAADARRPGLLHGALAGSGRAACCGSRVLDRAATGGPAADGGRPGVRRPRRLLPRPRRLATAAELAQLVIEVGLERVRYSRSKARSLSIRALELRAGGPRARRGPPLTSSRDVLLDLWPWSRRGPSRVWSASAARRVQVRTAFARAPRPGAVRLAAGALHGGGRLAT
jgi:hypothetical protein